MGQMTDAKIAGWQKWADIDPATGEYREKLEKISQAAFELIKVVELERSGIRDGDGYWYGSDAMCGTMQDIVALYQWLYGPREQAEAFGDKRTRGKLPWDEPDEDDDLQETPEPVVVAPTKSETAP